MEEQTIDYHLNKALLHLETALHLSVRTVLEDEGAKTAVGGKWESFLAQFFGHVRDKGKKARINLLNFISFPRIR